MIKAPAIAARSNQLFFLPPPVRVNYAGFTLKTRNWETPRATLVNLLRNATISANSVVLQARELLRYFADDNVRDIRPPTCRDSSIRHVANLVAESLQS